MKRFILALALIASIAFLTLPTSSQGLLVVQRKVVTSTAPPLPAFDNVVAAYGLNNFNPAGYPEGTGVGISGTDIEDTNLILLSAIPYPLFWDKLIELGGSPPYFINTWADQNSNTNDLIQSGAARPTLDTIAKEIDFDGTDDCLATAGSLMLGTTATAYLRFKTTDVTLTDILFEVGATPTATPFALSVRTVAGVLTVTVTDSTGLLFNTKTFNVSSNTWYIVTVIIDTAQGTASNQVKLLVNNSTSGVSSPVSTNLASGNLADGVLNVGARNQASAFFTGSQTDLLLFSVAHTPTQATAWYDYINQVLYP